MSEKLSITCPHCNSLIKIDREAGVVVGNPNDETDMALPFYPDPEERRRVVNRPTAPFSVFTDGRGPNYRSDISSGGKIFRIAVCPSPGAGRAAESSIWESRTTTG